MGLDKVIFVLRDYCCALLACSAWAFTAVTLIEKRDIIFLDALPTSPPSPYWRRHMEVPRRVSGKYSCAENVAGSEIGNKK